MAVLAALSSATALSASNACAGDIAFDGSLPGTTAGALNAVDGTYAITQSRGFTNGTNLFHSFDIFNLDPGETAVFSGNAGIANIISRVTGGIPTTIDGTVSSTIQGANFWFVNPAGLTVGPTGMIDVSGAIALGAADFINFQDGQFLASTVSDDVTLLVSNPASFGFLGDTTSGTLTIQSAQVLAAAASPNPPVGIDSPYSMQLSGGGGVVLQTQGDINLTNTRVDTSPVNGGEVILQAGGNITLDNSDLRTDSGNVLQFGIGGINIAGGGQVTLKDSEITGLGFAGVRPVIITGSGVRLESSRINVFSGGNSAERAAIQIGALGTASDGPGAGVVTLVNTDLSTANTGTVQTDDPTFFGEIAVLGENVRLEDSNISTAGRNGGGNDIVVGGSQSVAIVGVNEQSSLRVSTGFGIPSAGNIVIAGGAQGTEITRSVIFSSSSTGAPNPFFPDAQVGGIVVLGNDGAVRLTDATLQTNAQAIINPTDAIPDETSNIGISGASVHIRGGEITTSVNGQPTVNSPNAIDAGDIIITTTGNNGNTAGIVIDGGARIRSDALNGGANLQNGMLLSVTDAGNITLAATGGGVRLGSSLLETSAGMAAGSAGSIAITGDSIALDGATARTTAQSLLTADGSTFVPASIMLTATGSVLLNNSTLDANTSGVIQAGSITAAGSSVTIGGSRGSSISSSSTGSAVGGDIAILAQDDFRITNSSLSASAGATAGGSGRIDVIAGSVLAVDSSFDTSNASTAPIPLDPDGFPIPSGSDITMFAGRDVILRNTQLTTQTTGTAQAGAISVIGDTVHISGGQITASTTLDPQQTAVMQSGAAGDINVMAVNADATLTSVVIDSGAQLRSSATGSARANVQVGGAGAITIATPGGVSIANSRLESSSSGPNAGAAGRISVTGATAVIDSVVANVAVETQRADLLNQPTSIAGIAVTSQSITVDNSTFTTTSSGVLGAGAIAIAAALDGVDADGNTVPVSGSLVVRNSSLSASSTGTANAGANVLGSTGDLSLLNTTVESSSQGPNGSFAGQALVAANGNAVIDNSSIRTSVASQTPGTDDRPDAPAPLVLVVGGGLILNNSSLQASTTGARVGGSISIDAATVRITGSTLSAESLATGTPTQTDPSMASATFTPGASGSITLRIAGPADEQVMLDPDQMLDPQQMLDAQPMVLNREQVLIQGSSITTNAVGASGGNISLDVAGSPLLLRDSTIRASAGAAGTGGNVLIDNADRTIVQRSQIVARADAGNGGTITINVNDGALFVRDAQSFINADSNSGNDGDIDINSPDTDLNPAVKAQDAELTSNPELSVNACAPRTEMRSTFVREGRGGVSAQPDSYLAASDSARIEARTARLAVPEIVRVAQADGGEGGCH